MASPSDWPYIRRLLLGTGWGIAAVGAILLAVSVGSSLRRQRLYECVQKELGRDTLLWVSLRPPPVPEGERTALNDWARARGYVLRWNAKEEDYQWPKALYVPACDTWAELHFVERPER